MKKNKLKKVLAYDLGGTKVHVAVVDEKGHIVEETKVPVAVELGKNGVIKQLADLGQNYLDKYPEIRKVGVASAGPLDPLQGLLLDPTNMSNPNDKKKSWGKVHITKLLRDKLKRTVFLENDAAAAMLAEHWLGKAKGYDNAMILTLGTGLGTGIISNGELLRAGHYLHPESGHMVIRAGDPTAPCGCGNNGCAEGFLSGRSFTRRNRPRFARADYLAKDISDLAKKGDPRALAAFAEYAELMAVALNNYCSMYCPEIIVFTGSFAEAASLFLKQTSKHLEQHLSRRRVGIDLLPKLAVSALDNKAGVIGGAYVAFTRDPKLQK